MTNLRYKYDLSATFMDDLLELAMLEYASSNYQLSLELLKYFRSLAAVYSITVSFDKQLSSLWGSLSANFILNNFHIAGDLLIAIRTAIDSLMIGRYRKTIGLHVSLLSNWIPIILFQTQAEDGEFRDDLLKIFTSEDSVNRVIHSQHHLIPLLAIAVIANRKLQISVSRQIV